MTVSGTPSDGLRAGFSPKMRAATAAFGGDRPTTNLDLVLAVLLALGLPYACSLLLDSVGGALAGLAAYYLLGCVAIPQWRKGSLDYGRPVRWPWGLFLPSLLLPAALAAINWGSLPRSGAAPVGILLTALVWAPLNGWLEQLSWLYVLDAWRNRWRSGPLRWVGLAVGIVLLVALVTLIHLLFWARFLPVSEGSRFAWASIPLNLLLTAGYALMYYRARSFWPTFVVHTLVDLQLVLIAGYSILPDLW